MSKRIKNSSQFFKSISFDKSEIRKKIFVPSFRQARRICDFYDALIQEFYEDGCVTSAKYFQILIDKECTLYQNATIRDRILDEPKLLLSLFDSCKMAEKAALSDECNGPVKCTRLLLQCILMFQNYGKKYDWILTDVFRIIIKIADNVCQSPDVSKEALCQIYYKFGVYLTKCDLEEAVKYLENSFNLAQGTNWIQVQKSGDNITLHFSSVIANRYAAALLNYAENLYNTQPEDAISQVQKALIILTGEGIERNKNIYIKANLDMANFQLMYANYETSISILDNIAKHITSEAQDNLEYLKFLFRYHHLKGVCFKSVGKYDVALNELYKSLNIIRQLKSKRDEGILLMDIGQVYIKRGRSQFLMAENCLRQSKEIFISLNDMFNVKKASYRMGNVKMQNIQHILSDLIRFSSTNYCDNFRLTRWKSLCLPFWRNLRYSLEMEERRPLHCLLSATAFPDKIPKRITLQRKPPKN